MSSNFTKQTAIFLNTKSTFESTFGCSNTVAIFLLRQELKALYPLITEVILQFKSVFWKKGPSTHKKNALLMQNAKANYVLNLLPPKVKTIEVT